MKVNKTKQVLVPKLRFKRFDEEWKLKKLGDVGKIRMCKRVFNHETSEKGDIPFYKIGTFGKEADAYITKELYLNYKNRFSYPNIGDILISAAGTLGRTVVFDGSPSYYQDSNIVWIDNNEEIIINSFLFYIYQIVRYDSEGGTIQRLYNSIISNAKFTLPSLPEQQKIASFLGAVDEKIQLLTRKKELLENYKKGAMQQLFSQKLRFKDAAGKDFPEWEEKRLGDLCSVVTGKLDANAMKEDGRYRFYTCAREFYRIDEYAFDTEALLVSGNGANVGYIHYYKGKFNAYQRTYVLDGFVEDIIYVKKFLEHNLHKRIYTEKKEGNTPYITLNTLTDLIIGIPCLSEQQKIASFLSAIDEKIELVNQQITQSQIFKKGLLQQMFV